MSDVATTAVLQVNDAIASAQAAARYALSAGMPLSFQPVDAHSNFNYLFRCEHEGRRYFLKAALGTPRMLDLTLPRDRVFMEAQASAFFLECSGGLVDVPEVVHVDRSSYSFLMSDVGAGKDNLAEVLSNGGYSLYAIGIPSMAESIGRCHRQSRNAVGAGFPVQDDELRAFIYGRLIGVGIRALVGRHADEVLDSLESTRECLIHSDLWAKNMLIDRSGRMALLDFEGAINGDPVFDLATIIAAGLMPVYQFGVPFDTWKSTAEDVLNSYARGLDDENWFSIIVMRLIPSLAVMLAARVAGPFPYTMSEDSRKSMNALCCELIEKKIVGWERGIEVLRRYTPRS
jgi:hypothetical protein